MTATTVPNAGPVRRSCRWIGRALRFPFATAARRIRQATHAHGAGESGLAKLIELHAVNSAGDMMITVALASTVFFSVPTGEARGRVALYLAVTMAPFAVLAPVIGPLLDRVPHGRRAATAGAMLVRALLALTMAGAVTNGGLQLYPAALGALVASKAYGVVRSAVVPRLLPPRISLVKANSRVTLGGLLATGAAAPVGAGLHQIGPGWPLYGAFAIFITGTLLSFTLPAKVDSSKGEARVQLSSGEHHLRRSGRPGHRRAAARPDPAAAPHAYAGAGTARAEQSVRTDLVELVERAGGGERAGNDARADGGGLTGGGERPVGAERFAPDGGTDGTDGTDSSEPGEPDDRGVRGRVAAAGGWRGWFCEFRRRRAALRTRGPGLRSVGPSVLHALQACCSLKTLSGFLTLFLAFLLREHPLDGLSPQLLLGVVAVAAGGGNALGTALGAWLRSRGPEKIIVAALTSALAVLITSTLVYDVLTVTAVAAMAGISMALAKLSLDALIQRDVPEQVRTSAFSRSETSLQLAWVIGGAVGIALPLNGVLGLSVAAGVITLGAAATVRGLLAAARRGSAHPRVA